MKSINPQSPVPILREKDVSKTVHTNPLFENRRVATQTSTVSGLIEVGSKMMAGATSTDGIWQSSSVFGTEM